MVEYFVRIAAWLSQGINCILLFGSQDQTISARAYMNRDNYWWGLLYSFLNSVFFWQEDHCLDSHQSDLAFSKNTLMREYRLSEYTFKTLKENS